MTFSVGLILLCIYYKFVSKQVELSRIGGGPSIQCSSGELNAQSLQPFNQQVQRSEAAATSMGRWQVQAR